MALKKAVVEKKWGEIGLGSKKHDGWAWEVTLYEGDKVYDRRIFDYYTAEGCQLAIDCAMDWDEDFAIELGKPNAEWTKYERETFWRTGR